MQHRLLETHGEFLAHSVHPLAHVGAVSAGEQDAGDGDMVDGLISRERQTEPVVD